MRNNTELERIFSDVGRGFGYENVTAGYSMEADLKLSWRRTSRNIDFWVSDFFEGASEDILHSLAESIYSRIMNNGAGNYSPMLTEYLNSDEFVIRNQPLYMSRLPGLTPGPVGRYKDLDDSVRRLKEAGLIDDVPFLTMGWMPLFNESAVGHSSGIMRSVCICRRFDSDMMSDELLDYAVFSQIGFVGLGFIEDKKVREKKYQEILDRFPDRKLYDRMLDELGANVFAGLSPWS